MIVASSRVSAEPPTSSLHIDAAEAERGRLAQRLDRKGGILVPVARMRHHFGARKVPRGLLNCALFFGEFKVHASGLTGPRRGRQPRWNKPRAGCLTARETRPREQSNGRRQKPAGPDFTQGVPLASIADGAVAAWPCRRRRGPAGAAGRGSLRDRRRVHALPRPAGRGRDRGRHGALPLASRLLRCPHRRGAACAGAEPARLLEGRARSGGTRHGARQDRHQKPKPRGTPSGAPKRS